MGLKIYNREYDARYTTKRNRGRERFVVHHGKRGKRKVYYTSDHYKTFYRIR
ncbi:ribonuclease domain-containing protein [Macrococcoides caseolyticum]|uniref:ribonuclease domain-containing protein n=1 Tax=Macrococcoides caseolyticum TaxID=69966 RepID=UPI0039C921CD